MLTLLTETILFTLFLFLCLYLPGKLLITKLKLKLQSHETLFFPVSLGLIYFLLIYYILAWVGLETFLLPIFLFIACVELLRRDWLPRKIEKTHQRPLYLVIGLSFIFSLSMVVTGIFGDTFIYRHDDLWHLALINELKTHFPPDNPGAAGVPLRGYHFFYDMIVAQVSNLFFLASSSLHFRWFPLLIAWLWGIGVYCLLFRWSKSTAVALWGVFLTMFGGSFAFALSLQGRTSVGFENGLGIAQPADALYNPPLALSIIFIIFALFSLYNYLSMRQKRWAIPLLVSIGLVAMVKVYAGIVLIGGFLLLTIIEVLKRRFILLGALFVIEVLFLSTYWLFAGGTGHLIFDPLWPSHRLLQSFPWYGYDEKMFTFSQHHVIKGIIETELYGLGLFILGNLGTRLFGVLFLLVLLVKQKKTPSLFSCVLFAMLCISLFVPLFFIQSGKVYETIQMTEYYLFFVSLFAAFGFASFFRLRFNKIVKSFLFLLVIGATLPSTVAHFIDYHSTVKAKQSLSEPAFGTLQFLSQQTAYDATVLEMPQKDIAADDKSLEIWYAHSTPLPGALANKRMYFNNTFNEYPGVNKKQRFAFLKELILLSDLSATDSTYHQLQEKAIKDLRKNQIHYIYSSYEIPVFEDIDGIKKIYEQKPYVLYQVY